MFTVKVNLYTKIFVFVNIKLKDSLCNYKLQVFLALKLKFDTIIPWDIKELEIVILSGYLLQ